MIKAKDLRIGDIVRVKKDCFFKKGTIGKVADMYSLRQYVDKKGSVILESTEDDALSHEVWCCNIEGIPLTPEILEKNGWSKRHDCSSSCDIYSKGKGSFHVRLEQCIYKKQEGFDFAVGDSTYRFGNKIKHVHELQHILWALGESSDINI